MLLKRNTFLLQQIILFLSFFSLPLFKTSCIPFSPPCNSFFKTSSPFYSRLAASHWSVIEASNWISVFIKLDGSTTKVRTATLCKRAEDATAILQRKMCNQSLTHDNSCDCTVIAIAVKVEEMISNAYSYTSHKTGEVLSTGADVYSTGVYT